MRKRSQTTQTDGLIDSAMLNSVFQDMPSDLQDKIKVEFSKDIDRFSNDLIHAKDNDDLNGFERATHGLTGISAAFGAQALFRVSEKANALSLRGESQRAFSFFKKIIRLCDETLIALNEALDVDENRGTTV